MKKLIVSMVMLAGALVASASCSEGAKCPFGYQIKIFVKTTAAQKAEPGCGSVCLRVPATKRLAGFIYGTTSYKEPDCGCGEGSCGCNEWKDAEFLMWDYDTKKEAMPKSVKLVQLDRIYNGDTKTVELTMSLDGNGYDMNIAGFGNTAKRNDVWTLKSASGFCAGVIPAEVCKFPCSDVASAVWTMCANENQAPDFYAKTTSAYGKWTLNWSPTVYSRLLKGEQVSKPGVEWDEIKPIAIK